MKSLTSPEIPKRTTHCGRCGELFAPGMEVYSWLHENNEHQINRNDYCAACWQEIQLEVCSKPESKGYWKSKIESKKVSPASSRVGRALQLLRELKNNPEGSAEELFVLCLFLAHARQLALQQGRIRIKQALHAAGPFRAGDGADARALAGRTRGRARAPR